MNNRNWIAVFLGLACLVLFVSVMGISNNWTNSNNNSGTSPQQINQTLKGMNKNNEPNNIVEDTENKINQDMNNNSQQNPASQIELPQLNQ